MVFVSTTCDTKYSSSIWKTFEVHQQCKCRTVKLSIIIYVAIKSEKMSTLVETYIYISVILEIGKDEHPTNCYCICFIRGGHSPEQNAVSHKLLSYGFKSIARISSMYD